MSSVQPAKSVKCPQTTTIFLSNLPTKLRKDRLRRLMYALCTPYGQILDIVVMRRPARLLGTAFVVFKEAISAELAVQALQRMPFMGRTIRVEAAHGNSRAKKEFEYYVLGENGAVSAIGVRPDVEGTAGVNMGEADMDVD